MKEVNLRPQIASTNLLEIGLEIVNTTIIDEDYGLGERALRLCAVAEEWERSQGISSTRNRPDQ
jgi:hypothetical protein